MHAVLGGQRALPAWRPTLPNPADTRSSVSATHAGSALAQAKYYPTIVEAAKDNNLNAFAKYLADNKLVDAVEKAGPVTIFAPSECLSPPTASPWASSIHVRRPGCTCGGPCLRRAPGDLN
jgi:hypothetical protein